MSSKTFDLKYQENLVSALEKNFDVSNSFLSRVGKKHNLKVNGQVLHDFNSLNFSDRNNMYKALFLLSQVGIEEKNMKFLNQISVDDSKFKSYSQRVGFIENIREKTSECSKNRVELKRDFLSHNKSFFQGIVDLYLAQFDRTGSVNLDLTLKDLILPTKELNIYFKQSEFVSPSYEKISFSLTPSKESTSFKNHTNYYDESGIFSNKPENLEKGLVQLLKINQL